MQILSLPRRCLLCNRPDIISTW